MASKSPCEWLEDAAATVEERGKTHGHYQDMAEMLARRWNAYLEGPDGKPRKITPKRSMKMLGMLKEVRDDLVEDDDHKRDMLGYDSIYCAVKDKR